jgi:hypothetical protein
LFAGEAVPEIRPIRTVGAALASGRQQAFKRPIQITGIVEHADQQ